jgi:hypothetical protein
MCRGIVTTPPLGFALQWFDQHALDVIEQGTRPADNPEIPRNTCFSCSLAATCFEIGLVGITVLTLGAARNGPIFANRPCTKTGETEG